MDSVVSNWKDTNIWIKIAFMYYKTFNDNIQSDHRKIQAFSLVLHKEYSFHKRL